MKTLTLDVVDETKFQLLLDVLHEFRFVQIAASGEDAERVKTMNTLPPSALHPYKVSAFAKFSREELHAR